MYSLKHLLRVILSEVLKGAKKGRKIQMHPDPWDLSGDYQIVMASYPEHPDLLGVP